jgi:PAS domain S-box-containing protein
LGPHLAQSGVVALLVTDAEGSILLASPAAERLFGWRAGEMAGLPVSRLLCGTLRPGISMQVSGRHKDGREVAVEALISELPAGPAVRVILLGEAPEGRRSRTERWAGMPASPQALNLSELVSQMSASLDSALSRTVVLECHLDSNLPQVMADPAQVRQVVTSLVTNAVEAIGPDNGIVTIQTGVRQERFSCRAFVSVSDTGPGVPEAIRGSLFEPYSSTKGFGRGMGLASARGIVHSHGGEIEVRSHPGAGATFTILLPADHH